MDEKKNDQGDGDCDCDCEIHGNDTGTGTRTSTLNSTTASATATATAKAGAIRRNSSPSPSPSPGRSPRQPLTHNNNNDTHCKRAIATRTLAGNVNSNSVSVSSGSWNDPAGDYDVPVSVTNNIPAPPSPFPVLRQFSLGTVVFNNKNHINNPYNSGNHNVNSNSNSIEYGDDNYNSNANNSNTNNSNNLLNYCNANANANGNASISSMGNGNNIINMSATMNANVNANANTSAESNNSVITMDGGGGGATMTGSSSLWMREQDADLLESIHFTTRETGPNGGTCVCTAPDSCCSCSSTAETPILGPIKLVRTTSTSTSTRGHNRTRTGTSNTYTNTYINANANTNNEINFNADTNTNDNNNNNNNPLKLHRQSSDASSPMSSCPASTTSIRTLRDIPSFHLDQRDRDAAGVATATTYTTISMSTEYNYNDSNRNNSHEFRKSETQNSLDADVDNNIQLLSFASWAESIHDHTNTTDSNAPGRPATAAAMTTTSKPSDASTSETLVTKQKQRRIHDKKEVRRRALSGDVWNYTLLLQQQQQQEEEQQHDQMNDSQEEILLGVSIVNDDSPNVSTREPSEVDIDDYSSSQRRRNNFLVKRNEPLLALSMATADTDTSFHEEPVGRDSDAKEIMETEQVVNYLQNIDAMPPSPPDEQLLLRHRMTRTTSMDRRMNEVAQFAEAVGDLTAMDRNGVRIIDDDDDKEHIRCDEDDDDDNAPEIRVERLRDPAFPVNLPAGSSHKTKSQQQQQQQEQLLMRQSRQIDSQAQISAPDALQEQQKPLSFSRLSQRIPSVPPSPSRPHPSSSSEQYLPLPPPPPQADLAGETPVPPRVPFIPRGRPKSRAVWPFASQGRGFLDNLPGYNNALGDSSLVGDEYYDTTVVVSTADTSMHKNTSNAGFAMNNVLTKSSSNLSVSHSTQIVPSQQQQAQQANSEYAYKGIRSNPPDVVKRGTARGNYAQLHRKAWLEVSDKYHRYGKNLRLYYRYWERLGCPTNMFFDWLDSKGEAAGQPLPELEECPRSQLDSDTVLYITNLEVTERYALRFERYEEMYPTLVDPTVQGMGDQSTAWSTNSIGSTSFTATGSKTGFCRVYNVDGDPINTGPDGWIFVLRDNVMYGAQKVTSVTGHSKQRFHHSSFFGGKAVAAAGIFITDEDGFLLRLYPHSGHYRPGEAHVQRVLYFLYQSGVDLRTFEMDTQQIQHVARDEKDKTATSKAKKPKEATLCDNQQQLQAQPPAQQQPKEKKKKTESLHLMPAFIVACFLAHKARFIGEGIFAQIHKIRKSNVASVSEALALIDNEFRDYQSHSANYISSSKSNNGITTTNETSDA